MRTAETALLFFQYIMAASQTPRRSLWRGAAQWLPLRQRRRRIVKKQLLTHFNLHTIVRLPNGVFAPYTGIPTNMLFFEACETSNDYEQKPCTKEVWYYELPLPEGRNSYSKTKPMQYEEFRRLHRLVGQPRRERARLESPRRANCWPTTATWIARTPTPRKISSTCLPSNWSKVFCRKSSVLWRLWARLRRCWGRKNEIRCINMP